MVALLLTTLLQVLKSVAVDLLSAFEGLEYIAHNTQSVKWRYCYLSRTSIFTVV